MSKPLPLIRGRAVPLLWDSIDTDALVPVAPYKAILGGRNERLREILLYEFRFGADGRPKSDFILNDPRFTGAAILVAGENFGCGSSRENAVWALKDYGFEAVVAKSFADIFEHNAYKNHFVPAKVDPAKHARLVERVQATPDATIVLDLEAHTLQIDGDLLGAITLDEMGRELLLTGLDEFALTARYRADIERTINRLVAANPWLG
jgi:3-isopropylmalate dehydratase small subunit